MTHLAFDGYLLDLEGCRLTRDGAEVPLERRAMDMLCYLAANAGRLVSKDELMAEVWRARALSPGVLGNTAAKLRRALGQPASEQAPLETVRGRGYRFHAAGEAPAPGVPPAESVGPTASARLVGELEPFVGRAEVLEQLAQARWLARSGQAQLVLVVGEPGIGKTRTLAELAQRAAVEGFSVWHGAAYDGGGAPAYWPWVEVLRAAQRDVGPDAWRRHLAGEGEMLARLVPDLMSDLASAAGPDHADEVDAFQLRDALTRLLASASETRPRLVVLDDLHWANAETLSLLAHTAEALTSSRVLLAASLREREVDDSASHRHALARLSRKARWLGLRGLTRADITQLIAHRHGPEVAARGGAKVLARRTQGNPYFVLQMMALASQRGLCPDAKNLKALEAPPAVRRVIGQRLSVLDAATQDALGAAAVIGQHFDAPLLAALTEQSMPALLARLERARQLGVLHPDAAAHYRFSFTHALAREALYDQLPLDTAGALHARLTGLLEVRLDPGDGRQLGELARHALLSVPFDRARCLTHCRGAARKARAEAAFDAAAKVLLRAHRKLLSEGAAALGLADLALEAGHDQFCAGDLVGAFQTFSEAAERVHGLPEAGALRARLAFGMLACDEAGAGDQVRARSLLEQALCDLDRKPRDVRAGLLAHRAGMAHDLPFEARVALLDEAEALAAADGDSYARVEVAHCRASLRDPTRLPFNRAAARALRGQLARHAGGLSSVRRALWDFSADLTEYLCALTAGDLAAADQLADAARARDGHTRPVALTMVLGLMEAGRALGAGELSTLEACIGRMQTLSSRIAGGLKNAPLYYALLLSEARGRVLPRQLLRFRTPARHADRYRVGASIIIARLLARLGLGIGARAVLARLPEAELARMPVMYGDLGSLCALAETYDALGDVPGAKRLLTQLAPHAHANAVGPCLDYAGSVEHYLGLLAMVVGDRDQAGERIARALAVNERLGMPLQAARTRTLQTRLSTQ